MEPILKVENLKTFFPVATSIFGKKKYLKAVNDVSFEVFENETFGLVGESGCGKSTLGRTIVKIYDPTEGKVWFKGKDISTLKGEDLKKFRKEAQMIFQDPYASLNARTAERVFHEMTRTVCGRHVCNVLLEYADVFGVWIPEI
ncbi:MAG: ATP-binding cassette domain-containing protein, partial [Clostridia bacterium]|nr:ATP-binding cassette domain-containing protein [Clostridia bacterium]